MTSRQKHVLNRHKLVLTGMKIHEHTDMREGEKNQSGLNTPLPTDGLMAFVGV